jgi:hypothetical protein
MPEDIHLASYAKNLVTESESPKVDKPPSPSTGKTFPDMSKPRAQKTLMPQLVP